MSVLAIRVPATTANLGPGFDALGVALSLYDVFHVRPASRSSVSGCERKYAGSDNLFLGAMRYASSLRGEAAPEISLDIEAAIPIARGLGSSAALIVGGVAAALLLSPKRIPGSAFDAGERRFILDASAALEGHPDNAASAVFGGFCASIALPADKAVRGAPPKVVCSRSEVAPGWVFHALVPPFELSTAEARAALPEVLPRADAVFNLGRAALVALAFEKKDASVLSAACGDSIHQRYRKTLIPGYDEVTEACGKAGASAVWLSGAGPSILALTTEEGSGGNFSAAIAPVLGGRSEGPWRHIELSADTEGVRYVYE